ncbi:MAG TPA: transglutaminase-like domain-containing protein [Acidimicrobiales bacterium]|nr:transglutaminase-like domain-containing protein [Acidimicrobiales bacterium]
MTSTEKLSYGAAAEKTAFYRAPGIMTDLAGCPAVAFGGLPGDPVELCRVVQGLLVHEMWASSYGLDLSDERRQQVRIRPAAAMVQAILGMDPRPLSEPRPADRRLVGNCRHFATLSTALLRRAGIPARARCGFAGYFEPGKMVDHWVTEYRTRDGWVRIDAQIDEVQQRALGLVFDPSDLPADVYLPAGEAWTRCRSGQDSPDRYGIFDMWGLWFVSSNLIRDLAALNKMELLPWDSWGPMTFRQDPGPQGATLLDRVASKIDTDDLTQIRGIYQSEECLAVPDTVFDGRFGETCPIVS